MTAGGISAALAYIVTNDEDATLSRIGRIVDLGG
jgi:hypothetical protein